MKRLLLAVLLVVMLLLAANVLAQDTAPECDAAKAGDIYKAADESLATAKAALDKGDVAAFLDALGAMQSAVAQATAECNGLSFSGKNAKVLGPVSMPTGTYRVTATTAGYFIADLDVVSGTCDVGSFSSNLFILSAGQGEEGAETILKSEDCEVLIKLDNITKPWTLTFEKIK